MKRLFIFLLLTLPQFSSQTGSVVLSPAGKKILQKEGQVASNAILEKSEDHMIQSESAPIPIDKGVSDVMVIDPRLMAKDWIDAFQLLRSKNVSPAFLLKDHSLISQVISIEPLSGGYLLVFSLKTTQGVRYRVVRTSDIISLLTK